MKGQVYFFPLLTSLQLLQMLMRRIWFFFTPCLCWFSLHKNKQSYSVSEICWPFWNVSPVKFLLIKDQVFIKKESQKTEMYVGYFNWFQEISYFFRAIQILLFVNNSPLKSWEIYKANLFAVLEKIVITCFTYILCEKLLLTVS